jgi:hypothetical protein
VRTVVLGRETLDGGFDACGRRGDDGYVGAEGEEGGGGAVADAVLQSHYSVMFWVLVEGVMEGEFVEGFGGGSGQGDGP